MRRRRSLPSLAAIATKARRDPLRRVQLVAVAAAVLTTNHHGSGSPPALLHQFSMAAKSAAEAEIRPLFSRCNEQPHGDDSGYQGT